MRATVAKKVTEREGNKEKIKFVWTLDVADRDKKLIEKCNSLRRQIQEVELQRIPLQQRRMEDT